MGCITAGRRRDCARKMSSISCFCSFCHFCIEADSEVVNWLPGGERSNTRCSRSPCRKFQSSRGQGEQARFWTGQDALLSDISHGKACKARCTLTDIHKSSKSLPPKRSAGAAQLLCLSPWMPLDLDAATWVPEHALPSTNPDRQAHRPTDPKKARAPS